MLSDSSCDRNKTEETRMRREFHAGLTKEIVCRGYNGMAAYLSSCSGMRDVLWFAEKGTVCDIPSPSFGLGPTKTFS